MMMVLAAFTALLAAWFLWLAFLQQEAARPAPAATPDPYAAEIAEFRRQVHEWDRG